MSGWAVADPELQSPTMTKLVSRSHLGNIAALCVPCGVILFVIGIVSSVDARPIDSVAWVDSAPAKMVEPARLTTQMLTICGLLLVLVGVTALIARMRTND